MSQALIFHKCSKNEHQWDVYFLMGLPLLKLNFPDRSSDFSLLLMNESNLESTLLCDPML